MNHPSKLPETNDTQEILEHYRQLQIANPAQREAILDRWQNVPLPLVNLKLRASRIRIAAIAAVIVTLASDSAVVVWKRTMPKTADDGTPDWLSDIELSWQNGQDSRPLHHHWARPPQPQQWFWSIVKTTDGQPFDRGMIMMTLRSEGCRLSNSIVPLQFPEKTLDQLIGAAEKLLPDKSSGEPLTLQALRALARELR